MSATCPGCGVPVVPGYVRCPKCHRPLASTNKRGPIGAGGTAVEGGGGGLPLLPIVAGGGVVLGIILYFVLGKSDAKPKPADPTAPVAEEPAAADEPEDTPVPQPTPPTQAVQPVPQDNVNRIDPDAVARDLERALRNQRLWSSVEVVGKDVTVTTGSCRDANLIPTVSAAAQALRNAGLTRVRCLENSGAVVFERAL